MQDRKEIDVKTLRELIQAKSFEEIEKELGITEFSFEGKRNGYPSSPYYQYETEAEIKRKRKTVNRFLEKFQQ